MTSVIRRGILDACCGSPQKLNSRAVRQAFCFGPDFAGFAGHFPSEPILPAVVQISMGLLLAEMLQGPEADTKLVLEAVRRAKFMQKLTPGQEIIAECRQRDADDRTFDIALTVDESPASSFTLAFASPHGGQPDA